MRILMAAPFDSNGRFAGGIMFIANELMKKKDLFENLGADLSCFELCRTQRTQKENSFNFANIYNAAKIFFELPMEIKKSKSEVLYYHTSVSFALLKDLLAIRYAKKKTSVKTVVHIHFADYEKIINKHFEKIIIHIMKKYVDKFVFLSEKTTKQFVEHGVPEEKCNVLYNFASISLSPEEVIEKTNKQDEVIHFLFVGSIDERKGVFDALECFDKIKDDFVFHICGTTKNDDDQRRLNEYQEKLGGKLHFYGYVTGQKKREIYKKADVLLLPSYGEGLPIVILEALNTACSIITTDVGAIPEIISEKNGKIFCAGDKEKLMDIIIDYVSGEMSQNINEQKKFNYEISGQYSIESFITNVVNICK